MLRCHIKINDPRYYYWADVLGVTIFYDLPCTIVDGPTARRHWEATFRDAVARDANHPSIIAWILFLVIKAMNRLFKQEEAAPAPPAPPTREEELLTEIRDLLKARG